MQKPKRAILPSLIWVWSGRGIIFPYMMSKIVDQFRMILNPCDLAMLRGTTTRIHITLHQFCFFLQTYI